MALRKATGLIARPGAGKTRMILGALDDQNSTDSPIIINCSGPAVATWEKEIPKWLGSGHHIHIVSGLKPAERAKLWDHARTGEANNWFVTNYSIFLRDFDLIYGIGHKKAQHWGANVNDEYHKAFRRRKSQTFAKIKRLTQFMETHISASGSSMGRDPSTLFTLLQMCDRRAFSSYWQFVNTFCLVIDGYAGKQIVGAKPSAIPQFKAIIDKYLAYIPDAVTADEQPEGVRRAFDVKMTPKQANIYNQLASEMYAVIDGDETNVIMTGSKMDLAIKLRKLLCCPRILDPSLEMGGGYDAIVDTLDVQPHIIICVPFRDACDVVAAQLKIDLKTEDVFIIKGQIGNDELKKRLSAFRHTKGIIVTTIAAAESWDAETCETTFFLGYDQNTGQLQQAEGRTQRAISTHPYIQWKYVKYAQTIDEATLLDIDKTLTHIASVMSRTDRFINALKGVPNE
ncbi:MAG: hypothetical protein COA78_31465 [Blastopirellula sp.]|nr:MAG: hypothetical protein COA78_31465 [Blastopirellula sp.]